MGMLLIYAIILVSLLVGTWLRPAIALASLLCMKVLDFWGQMAHPFFFHYGKFTNIFMVALVGMGVLRAGPFSYRPYQMIPWVKITISGLLFYAALSLSWSPAFWRGVAEWSYSLPYIILHVALVPLLFRHSTDLQVGLSAVLVLGTVLVTNVDLFVNWDTRSVATFWDPNETIWDPLAFPQLAAHITLAAILLNPEKNWKWTAIRSIAIASSIVLVMLSESRGPAILMITIPMVFVPFSRPIANMKNYVVWAFLGIGLVSLSLYALNSFTAMEGRWSSSTMQSDWDIRVHGASVLLHHWWRASSGDPVTLILGLGNSASYSSDILSFHPHLVAVEILGEEGILGIGILL